MLPIAKMKSLEFNASKPKYSVRRLPEDVTNK